MTTEKKTAIVFSDNKIYTYNFFKKYSLGTGYLIFYNDENTSCDIYRLIDKNEICPQAFGIIATAVINLGGRIVERRVLRVKNTENLKAAQELINGFALKNKFAKAVKK